MGHTACFPGAESRPYCCGTGDSQYHRKSCRGIADDMLSTTIMAANSPVLFVPAMNDKMYENPIVQENIKKLASLGYLFMEPDTGHMACGTSGKDGSRLRENCGLCKGNFK